MNPRPYNSGPILRRRGPVIERANEPGIPRGLTRLFVLAALGGGLYVSGYWPDTRGVERAWGDAVAAFNQFWDPPKPAPPQRTASAPPARPASPPVAPPISRPTPPPQTPTASAPPPASPPAATSDGFRDSFMRDVLGRLSNPNAPARPSPAQPAMPSLPPDAPPVAVPPPGANEANRPPAVAAAPPAAPATPAPAPERSTVFARPPGTPPASLPFTPDSLDKLVERELTAFNASRDVPVKRAAMQRVVAAAQLGHGPARGVIVRGFPVSTIIRDVVAPADAVRFALDFVIHKRAFSNDARRDFIALAAFFDGERRDAQFGQAVFDAVRDDERLQAPAAINDLMFLLYRAERGCIALRRHIDVFDPNTSTTGHCGADLALATPAKAKQAGPAGVEAKRFQEALDMLRTVVAEPI